MGSRPFAHSMLKQRAATARLHASATKAWDTHVKTAVVGSVWRVTSAWIEERCGTCCADLTHVSTGKMRTVRCTATDSVDALQAQIVSE